MRPSTRPEGTSVSKTRAIPTKHASDKIGIFRLFSRARGGYYFHVTLRRDGKIFQKDFFEKRCGGRRSALKLAQAWRDTIIVEHPAMSMAKFCSIVRSNNTSGIPGVCRAVKGRSAKNVKVALRAYWRASIPLGDGKSRIQNFSVRTYGEEEAKQLAIDARMHALRELEGMAYKAAHQPQPVSTEDDLARLEAALRAPAERRQRRAEERQQQVIDREAKQLRDELRAVEKMAQARTVEETALGSPTNRTGEPYIGRYASAKGTSFYWRVSIIRQGARHRKIFSDSAYGGE
ncbi:MAG: AP2/ERF family transcription factor, partial [Telluria sp.]